MPGCLVHRIWSVALYKKITETSQNSRFIVLLKFNWETPFKPRGREQWRFLNRYNVISIEAGNGYSYSWAANHFVTGLPMKNESDNEVQWNSIDLPLFWKCTSKNFRGSSTTGAIFSKCVDKKCILFYLWAPKAPKFFGKISPKSLRTSRDE